MPAEADGSVATLRALVSRPYAVEVLDVLGAGPLSRARICTLTGLRHRRAARVLKDLAAEGMVTRFRAAGTWDGTDTAATRYMLTAAGRAPVRELDSLVVWNRIFAACERGDR